MSEIIINDDCVLIEIANKKNAFYEKGYRYMLEGKKLGSKTMLLTDAEFNRLAMEAPICKRMVDKLNVALSIYREDHPEIYIVQQPMQTEQLLAEIAELEKP